MSDFLGTDLMQLLARSQSSGASNPLAELQGQEQPAPDKTSEALRQKLIQQMTEQVEPERLGIGQTLALALANAGSTYAAGINPNLRQQDFVNPAIALRERRARRETARRQGAARVGLDDLTRRDAIETRASERAKDRGFAKEQAELNRQSREALAQSYNDLSKEITQNRIASNEAIAGMNAEVRLAIAGQSAEDRAARLSESDKDFERELRGQLLMSVNGGNGIASLAERLASGETTVEAIRQQMQDMITSDGSIHAASRDRLLRLYVSRVEPILQTHEELTAPDEGPERPPIPGTESILEIFRPQATSVTPSPEAQAGKLPEFLESF